jgi:hypothetical protein
MKIEDVVKLIEERVKKSAERGKKHLDGEAPPETPIYLPAWTWLLGKVASVASESRMLFGKNAILIPVWIDEEHNVVSAYFNWFTNGIMNSFTKLEITNDLQNSFKGKTIEEGIKDAFNAVKDKIESPDDSYRPFLFAQKIQLFIDRAEEIGWEEKDEPDSIEEVKEGCKLTFHAYHSKPRKLDVYPMPPSMRAYFLMGQEKFMNWLKELTWPE